MVNLVNYQLYRPQDHNLFYSLMQTLFSSSFYINVGSTELTRLESTSLEYLSKCWKSVRTELQLMQVLLQLKVLLQMRRSRSRRHQKTSRLKRKRMSNCATIQSQSMNNRLVRNKVFMSWMLCVICMCGKKIHIELKKNMNSIWECFTVLKSCIKEHWPTSKSYSFLLA